MSSSKNGQGVHVLVFPYPAQGHILPLLDLTHHLALRRFTVTVLVTPKNLPILDPLLSAHPSIRTLVLPFPAGHPLLPPGVENVRDVGNWGNAPIMSSLSDLRRPIVDWFASHPDPPAAIIHDVFLGWVEEMAGEIGVPGICFYCHSAFLACVFEYGWRNMEKVKSLEVVDFEGMPKCPTFPREHLPSIMKNYKEGDPDWEGIRRGMIGNCKSWGVVVTTFHALEGVYLEFLKEKMGHGRVFPVGLLSLIGGPRGRGSGQGSLFAWLDGCPDESVLYVAFGSQKLMKQDQLEALCDGLERSGVRFVLVVKEPSAQQVELGFGFVSNEFEDRVKGRGLVIRGWASQVDILNHRAVCAFLSHCGWNSALESILAGVLVLGWPMEADQFVNAKLLVDYLGAGICVCEGTDTVPAAPELATKISDAINCDVLKKARVKELRDEALATVKANKGSIECLEELVKQLTQLQAS